MTLRETELYPPVKAYLEAKGYEVQAEVKGIDVVARRDNAIVAVELKTSINLSLLIQATKRQSITQSVYVAVPEPRRKGSQYRGTLRVLRQLHLGLLLVRFGAVGTTVEKIMDPAPFAPRSSRRRQFDVIEEFTGRSGSYNVGGTSGQPLMTAYREQAVVIAGCLALMNEAAPRILRALGTGDKTGAILAANHYGWFERVRPGVYRLTAEGRAAVEAYPALLAHSRQLIEAAE